MFTCITWINNKWGFFFIFTATSPFFFSTPIPIFSFLSKKSGSAAASRKAVYHEMFRIYAFNIKRTVVNKHGGYMERCRQDDWIEPFYFLKWGTYQWKDAGPVIPSKFSSPLLYCHVVIFFHLHPTSKFKIYDSSILSIAF